jgi:uncharacterized protein (TIGR03437 family)
LLCIIKAVNLLHCLMKVAVTIIAVTFVAAGGGVLAGQSIPISGNPVAGFDPVDQAATALMQKYSIPGMAIGITKGGRLVFARGYGFADVDVRSPVNPDSMFRLASVSKPLTATAADKLVELGTLGYDTKAFDLLSGLHPLPGGHEDPRVSQITVQELMMHESGWADDIGGNRFGDLQAAANALNLPLPGTFEGLIRYELGRPLDYNPGTQNHYCNFCYGVLAEVVQTASGNDYEAFVRGVLKNVGLTQTRIGRHLKTDKFPGEVTYYVTPGAPLVPPIYAGLPALVPIQYGGFTVDWGTGSAAGAWVSNTIELLRLVASVTLGHAPAMFTTSPRSGWAFSGLPIGRGWEWRHDGGIPGTSTTLHIVDDVAWCILTNTDFNGGPLINDLDAAVKSFLQTANWPGGDMFPQYLSNIALQPNISLVANAFGDAPLIAPNTWVEIKGTNLAPAGDTRIWQGSDFANNRLPTQIDGVSVTVGGKSAFVYYISPTQINILTPPDPLSGPVQVQATVGGMASNLAIVKAQQQALSFFDFVSSANGLPYVYARHADGSLVGPANLFPGLTTPAAPGENVVVAGNGFGLTDVPVIAGSFTQSGMLPQPWPIVKIDGIAATVSFAGLVAPGVYQFNIVVPSGVRNGDNLLTATYIGLSTQPGLLITCTSASQ